MSPDARRATDVTGLSSPLPQPPAESSSAHGKGGEDGMGPLESHGMPWEAMI